MKISSVAFAAAAMAAFPMVSVWAAGGSDVQPQTKRAAVAGASVGSHGVTTKPTSGTSGGGMSTGSGVKAGGMSKTNKVTTTGASD